MAIDTRSKRTSILSYGNVFMNSSPIPDGTINKGDRQQILWGYSGIDWQTPPTAVGFVSLTLTVKRSYIDLTNKKSEITLTNKRSNIDLTIKDES